MYEDPPVQSRSLRPHVPKYAKLTFLFHSSSRNTPTGDARETASVVVSAASSVHTCTRSTCLAGTFPSCTSSRVGSASKWKKRSDRVRMHMIIRPPDSMLSTGTGRTGGKQGQAGVMALCHIRRRGDAAMATRSDEADLAKWQTFADCVGPFLLYSLREA